MGYSYISNNARNLGFMTSTICVISTSPKTGKALVGEIKAVFPKNVVVKEGTYLQATAGVYLEVIEIAFFFISIPIAKGFLEELGKGTYDKLKGILTAKFSRNEERALVISFKSKETTLSFRLETDDESVVEAALEKIPDIVVKANKSM